MILDELMKDNNFKPKKFSIFCWDKRFEDEERKKLKRSNKWTLDEHIAH